MAKKSSKNRTVVSRGSTTAKPGGAAKKAVKKKAPKKKATKKKTAAPRTQSARKRILTGARANRAAEARRRESLKAVGIYEKGLHALQERKLGLAAAQFRKVIGRFPEERELHERSRRYLEVCERQSTPTPRPATLEERVYAATLALNNSTPQDALVHLESAASREPDNEQVQYMLALALAAAGNEPTAVSHLQRAIELNPDNRFLARHEPGFETMLENEVFQRLLATPDAGGQPPR